MNILKYCMKRKEYTYFLCFIYVLSSYFYKFGHIDLWKLRGNIDSDLLVLKITMFIILGILTLLVSLAITIQRLNDTKISKWSLLSLLIPYICILYQFALIFVPSKDSSIVNFNFKKIVIFIVFELLVVTIIYPDPVQVGSCFFLLMFFSLIILFFDFLIKIVLKIIKNVKNKISAK